MAFQRILLAVGLAAFAAASAEAATLYNCKGRPSAKDPEKTTIAVAVLDSSGVAIGSDLWSYDPKDPDFFWNATVHRNDAEVIDLRWTTDRQRSTQGAYARLRIALKVKKSDLSFRLALSGPDVREENLTGTCVKSTVKDFVGG
ncbi:MAG: hypothetical protein ACRCS0_13895 [Albidovulum sp.]